MGYERRTAGAGLGSQSEKDHSGNINVGQIIATTAAATTGALVANLLGVHGTLGGVALFSLISSLGTVLYTKSMWHTRKKLHAAARSVSYAQRQRGHGAMALAADSSQYSQPRSWGANQLKPVALTALVVFTLSLGTLSGIAALTAHDSHGLDNAGQQQTVSTVAVADDDFQPPEPNEADAVAPSTSKPADTVSSNEMSVSTAAFDKTTPPATPRAAGITEPRDPPLSPSQ